MNLTKCQLVKFGIVLSGVLLGSTLYGQPSVVVEVGVPLPTLEIRAESDFYEPLTPYGEWVVIGSYGRCWRPSRVEGDWRPYCNGNWERTEAGWYWNSDEPWGWATYHYGRWDFTGRYGWYWVPQTQWAPAWVSWHEGGGYIGWAPLQPSVTISAGGFVGFSESRIPPRAFVFVEQRQFLEPIRPAIVVVNNTTVINKTVVISNTRVVDRAVINEGPDTKVIEKASGRKVDAVRVQDLRHNTESAAVAKQPRPAERTAPTPAVAAPDAIDRKPAPATPQPLIEKPASVRPEPTTPDTKKDKPPVEPSKSTPPALESKPAPRSEAKPEVTRPATTKEPGGQNTDKPTARPERSAPPAENRAQPPSAEKPSNGEKGGPAPADKGQDKKSRE